MHQLKDKYYQSGYETLLFVVYKKSSLNIKTRLKVKGLEKDTMLTLIQRKQ